MSSHPSLIFCLVPASLSLHQRANLLGNLGVAFTFELFITLGLVLAVPVSAALDIKWYQVKFEGMKLAGIILIVCGFFLVLLPANWPEYITRLLRWVVRSTSRCFLRCCCRRRRHNPPP
ncbi:hypothetical protein Pcinc_028195 [Petrolisthes cinctipes]|uniref:Uncharacterized protein n=1 Tax=Petrolisthes cinctipes TaxID=88211 RepID=A0AAE1F3M7_PETCI|nr:hypothetical protein Pcinc_028195 [Petrolisthes cinctipes]